MAKKSGLNQRLYVGGYNISGDVGALDTISGEKKTQENTGIDKSAVERMFTQADGKMEFSCFFNDAAGQEHAALKSLPTTDVIATIITGQAAGDPAACLKAKQVNYDWDRGDDGSLNGKVECLASAGVSLEWCRMLTTGEDTHASAGTSTAYQDPDGASGSNYGIVGYLHIREIDSGTPTIHIYESSDDGSGDAYTAKLSFTAVADGSEPSAERKTATGAVEEYLQATSTGTFTNCDFVVAFRRGTVNDDEDLS